MVEKWSAEAYSGVAPQSSRGSILIGVPGTQTSPHVDGTEAVNIAFGLRADGCELDISKPLAC